MIASFVSGIIAILIVFTDNFPLLLAKSAVEGIATSASDPGKGAITLGILGPTRFEKYYAQNEIAHHSGSLVAAALGSFIAYISFTDVQWMFLPIGVLGCAASGCLAFVPSSLIDNDVARGLGRDQHQTDAAPSSCCSVLRNRNVVMLCLSVTLFHFGNAAVLPLLGQYMYIAIDSGKEGLPLSGLHDHHALIILAQLSSIFATVSVERSMNWASNPSCAWASGR
jgi:MFS family permease